MTQGQDDLIRDRAYAIWHAEGRPDGRREQHWHQAAAEIAQAREAASPYKAKPASVLDEALPNKTPAKPVARRVRKPAGSASAPSTLRRRKGG